MRLSPPVLASLVVLAVFAIAAGLGNWFAGFIMDRHTYQYLPLMQVVLPGVAESVQSFVAHLVRFGCGFVELSAGFLLLIGISRTSLRRVAIDWGCALLVMQFGLCLLVIFVLHHVPELTLPKWNQYPAILVWILATWMATQGAFSADRISHAGGPPS